MPAKQTKPNQVLLTLCKTMLNFLNDYTSYVLRDYNIYMRKVFYRYCLEMIDGLIVFNGTAIESYLMPRS